VMVAVDTWDKAATASGVRDIERKAPVAHEVGGCILRGVSIASRARFAKHLLHAIMRIYRATSH
jgi:hypothetical protein